jgi:multicomponent K+:H+ antiporter subunit G
MSPAAELPAWAALVTAVLLFTGAAITLIGALGLLRLKSFYERVHAPTLGTTLGAGCIVLASMIYFSVLQSRPVLHEILIAIFVTITTPVTLMILVRGAMLRDRSENAQRQAAQDKLPRPASAGGSPDTGNR